MAHQTDTDEDFIVNGNLTVLANGVSGDGSIEVQGTVYADTIMANLINGPVNLENIYFNTGNFTMNNITTPGNPTSGFTFYMINGLLVSINRTGQLTTYQPLTTKGDLLVYNSTTNTQDRLPVGNDGYNLVADSTSNTGVKWGASTAVSGNLSIIDLIGTNNSIVLENPTGSWIITIYPEVDNGSSCIIIGSKAFPANTGVFTRLCSNPSLITSGQISSIWNNYSGIEISKNYLEGEGGYKVNTTESYSTSTVTLSGTSTVLINSNLTGTLFLSVKPNNSYGPVATFFACKSDSSSNTSTISRLNSSQGDLSCTLQVTWPSNSGPLLSKSNSSDDGVYYIINNLSNTTNIFTITLSGTASTQIPLNYFPYYQDKSFFISIVSQVTNGPCSIFAISKNSYSLNGSQFNVNSYGVTTGERLLCTWNSDSLLFINKNGVNYDGSYSVIISKLL